MKFFLTTAYTSLLFEVEKQFTNPLFLLSIYVAVRWMLPQRTNKTLQGVQEKDWTAQVIPRFIELKTNFLLIFQQIEL